MIMKNTFTHHVFKDKVVTVVALNCYTIEEQDDVVVTDPEIIADYCTAQDARIGDNDAFYAFLERLNAKGLEFENQVEDWETA
jgi:hypothetical protein